MMTFACTMITLAALAQPAQVDPARAAPASTPPAEPAPAQATPAKKPAGAPQTLDELLGIKPAPANTAASGAKPAPGGTAPAAVPAGTPDPSKADLDRILTAAEIGDAFKQAIALMGDASSRLTTHADPGLDTQRIQTDVLKRLDQLLASLDQQQQQQQQQQGESEQDPQQKQDAPSQSKQQQGQQQQAQAGDGNRTNLGPPRQDGTLKSEIESARAAWGALPARIREMLLQGSSDRFSARYKALTEEYYKRLAEESGK